MKLLWLVSFITVIALVPSATAVLVITTNAATDITSGSVTLNGVAAGVVAPTVVWFEYSGTSTGYKYKTANQTITVDGAFSTTLNGVPLMTNSQYYYRAVGGGTSGAQVSFQMLKLTAIPDYNFDSGFQDVVDSKLNPTNMSLVASTPYTDILGSIFWGIVFSLIFVIIWIRQEDITIPTFLGLIIGASLWSSMPSDWTSMAMSLTVVSFAGLMYSILKSRS